MPIRIAWDISGHPDFRSAAEATRGAGFDGLTTSAAALGARELSQTGRREVRAILSRHALLGAALRADPPGKGLTQVADADRFLDLLSVALTAARDCGFALVACDLGRIPRSERPQRATKPLDLAALGALLLPETVEPPPPPARPLTEGERQHAAFAGDVMRALGALADRISMPIAFSASLATTADLTTLLGSAACPLFGRELDPPAALAEGPAGLVGLEPPVRHVRGRDAQAGAEGRQRPARLGKGDANWPELLEALDDAGFQGFISVHGGGHEAQEALEYLRRR